LTTVQSRADIAPGNSGPVLAGSGRSNRGFIPAAQSEETRESQEAEQSPREVAMFLIGRGGRCHGRAGRWCNRRWAGSLCQPGGWHCTDQ
jgi:hypothetical protein